MADIDHPKTHVEDQDVELPRKQPLSPQREGIDPLTESDTMYPAQNTKDASARLNKKEEVAAAEARQNDEVESEQKVADDVAAQKELNARDNTPNSLLDSSNDDSTAGSDEESTEKTDEEVAKDDGKVETKSVKEAVNEDNQQIEDGNLEDRETGTQNTSPSNKTDLGDNAMDDVKKAEKKVSTKTPKA